jgi:hypothetical protein
MALLVIDFNSRVTEEHSLTSERNRVATELSGHLQTQVSFQTQIAVATSPAGVEDWAYNDAHWIRRGEHLVVPVPGGEGTPMPTQTPGAPGDNPAVAQASGLAPVSNWQIWLSLFFDPAP